MKLYLCIDGVAPVGKMQRQRQRRFTHPKEHPNGFDSCCISPGTEFMNKVRCHITNYIKILEKNRTVSQVVFSSDLVPGEGEHKILEYIRHTDVRERCCIYSPDADLIMLCLCSNNMSLYVAREIDGITPCNMYYVDIEGFRKSLVNMYFRGCDQRRFILDFVLMFFMTGNDFLPPIPIMSIRENCIERFIDAYLNMDLSLTNTDLTINTNAMYKFLTLIASMESDIINTKANSKRRYIEDVVMDKNKVQVDGVYSVDINSYKKDFYKKIGVSGVSDVCNICKEYIYGLSWVLRYYVNGVTDWRWCYPYLYSPFVSDLANYIGSISDRVLPYKTNRNKPLDLMLQLMCIMPPNSFNILPEPYRNSYKEPEIACFYPSSVEIDMGGKYREYEGTVLLDPIDISKVELVYQRIKERLKNIS